MNDQVNSNPPELDIDPGFLTRMASMGGEMLVRELIQMYFARSEELVQSIAAGLTENQYEPAARAAHSLVSSSGNLGGQLVSYLSKEIERAAENQDISKLETLYMQLLKAQEAFIIYLQQNLESK